MSGVMGAVRFTVSVLGSGITHSNYHYVYRVYMLSPFLYGMLITIKRGSEQLQEDVPAKFRAACSRNGNLGGIYEKFEKPAAPGEPELSSKPA